MTGVAFYNLSQIMGLRFDCIRLCVAIAAVCAVAFSQDMAVDVHPSPPGRRMSVHMARNSGPLMADGLFQMRNATMLDIISAAYSVDSHKVTGGPQWLDWDRFDINALTPADSTAEGQKAMLRRVLADRFK